MDFKAYKIEFYKEFGKSECGKSVEKSVEKVWKKRVLKLRW